jgi:hypothetical protein
MKIKSITILAITTVLAITTAQAEIFEQWDFNNTTIGSQGTDLAWLAGGEPPVYTNGSLRWGSTTAASPAYNLVRNASAATDNNFVFRIRLSDFDHSGGDGRDSLFTLLDDAGSTILSLKLVTVKKGTQRTRLVVDPGAHRVGYVSDGPLPENGPLEFGIELDFINNQYTVFSDYWTSSQFQNPKSYDFSNTTVSGFRFGTEGASTSHYDMIDQITIGTGTAIPEATSASLILLGSGAFLATRRMLRR